MTRRAFAWLFLAAALLVAGVVSFYASAAPDGLERVAEDTGFGETAEDSAVADSPLADYRTDGIDDDRLAGGVAGVLGVLVTVGAVGGATWLLARRRGGAAAPTDPSGTGVVTGDGTD